MKKYIKGVFKERPNRFVAIVGIDGEEVIAHVPNTGRCEELLLYGATVYLLGSDNPKRKTRYSLLFVVNNGVLVSLYSQGANSIVYDGIKKGKIKELNSYNYYSREKSFGKSRIDIHLSDDDGNEAYIEVKGVTLIDKGVAKFPDAPTERGTKHLKELIAIKKQGYRAVVFFLIQHPHGNSFKPNWDKDPKFGETLLEAKREEVEILVYKTKNTLEKVEIIERSLEYNLEKDQKD